MRRILFIVMGVSITLFASFSKTGNIVTDSITALQWQDDNITLTTKTWTQAIDYCEALSLDGFSDWRLPNIRELNSLVDDSRANPAISPTFTKIVYASSVSYWSSTTYSGRTLAWRIGFDIGYQSSLAKSSSQYVRCVRAG